MRPRRSAQSSDSSDSSSDYEVETVLAHRIRKGVRQFRVKWKGYDLRSATWEDEDNLASCRLLVDEHLGASKLLLSVSTGNEQDDKYVDSKAILMDDFALDRIVGVTKQKSELIFKVTWRGSRGQWTYVPDEFLVRHYPLELLTFYQTNVKIV